MIKNTFIYIVTLFDPYNIPERLRQQILLTQFMDDKIKKLMF